MGQMAHEHGVAQQWCDTHGQCSCVVTQTHEQDPLLGCFITRRDESGCPLHDREEAR